MATFVLPSDNAPETATAQRASTRTEFTIGTRKSNLALVQTHNVAGLLQEAHPEYKFNIHTRDTAGDRDKTKPLSQFGSKNLWTEELEQLLSDGEIDFVVHSLK
ncbi:porphobilinogen deaminase, partial [Ascosphaera atra]